MKSILALLHSPLAGPLTWAPVSRELRRRGIETVLPVLTDDEEGKVPFWAQHATAVARRLESVPMDSNLILVGHSGAGPLLPVTAAFSPHPVVGYIFVDAGLPHPGKSRLDELEMALPGLAQELRQDLTMGGSFPQWTEQDLRDILPDEVMRQSVVAEMHPRGLAFFEEIMPRFSDRTDPSCAYLKFSDAYTGPAEQAKRNGWPSREIDAGHFHMLVDPAAVTETLVELMSMLA